MAREKWTDERLDDLNHKVDEGFRDMRGEFRAVGEAMREEFRAVRGEVTAVGGEVTTGGRSIRAEMAAMNRNFMSLFVVMVVGFAGTITTVLAHG